MVTTTKNGDRIENRGYALFVDNVFGYSAFGFFLVLLGGADLRIDVLLW